MKIILIQSGPDHEVLILGSLLIGLHKKYQGAEIVWVGQPQFFELVKYNKRIKRCVDVNQDLSFSSLNQLYGAEICINATNSKKTRKFASSIPVKQRFGFTKEGPVDRHAEFFQKVMTSEISTRKNVLDLYFQLAGLKWSGEGYGLSYYPRKKKEKATGTCLSGEFEVQVEDSVAIQLPKSLLARFDTLNQFEIIHTDNLFVAHAGIALRKYVHFYSKALPYQIEFFKKGRQVRL